MKKRILTSLVVCALALTLMPSAARAVGESVAVYQGDGFYITASEYGNQDLLKLDQSFFSDGLIRFRDEDNNYGFADKDGNVVISPKSLEADGYPVSGHFSDGLCPVYNAQGTAGYINKSGEMEVQPVYRSADQFLGGVAQVSTTDNETRLIDTSGKTLTSSDDRFWLGEGYFCEITTGNRHMSSLGKLLIYDQSGRQTACLTSPDVGGNFDQAPKPVGIFSEGYLALDTYRASIDYWDLNTVVIDPQGNIVWQGHGYRPASTNDEQNLYLTGVHSGVLVLSVTSNAQNELPYHGSNAAVNVQTGEMVIPADQDFYILDNFSDGLATVRKGPYTQNGQYGVVDAQGNYVIPLGDYAPTNTMPNQVNVTISPFHDGLAILKQQDMDTLEYVYYLLEKHEGTYSGPLLEHPSDWAAEQVNDAISKSIVPVSLRSDYTQPITQAEFCALAVDLYETVTDSTIVGWIAFSDTSDLNVAKMHKLGVATGVGDNRFDPDGTLAREQAATMLARLAQALDVPLAAQAPAFADNASISSWAFDAVGQMQSSGIMVGIGSNTFAPQISYSREQSILTMLRLYENVK